jgi:hypothetical protein
MNGIDRSQREEGSFVGHAETPRWVPGEGDDTVRPRFAVSSADRRMCPLIRAILLQPRIMSR